jgi:maltooligosyltrehalose trehalohydrolase
MRVGALYLDKVGCLFRVWAPRAGRVAVKILDGDTLDMRPSAGGYWEVTAEAVRPGRRYLFVLDGERERPDPASNFQPEGVRGPSAVVDHGAFEWQDDDWRGVEAASLVLYEIHTGAFTPEGTFRAAVARLDDLKDLGINALEIMPIAQFPGTRNWGYDGSFPYAAQDSYGGPEGLKTLVCEAHKRGIAVFLDVVYNHMGPEGCTVEDFGPYFSNRYRGTWGRALNFDEADSDMVRDFFIENALYWFRHFHLDGLRLDAVDAIFDQRARPFLEELAGRTAALAEECGRHLILTAESDLNDPRLIRPPALGGYGIDAQWADDFHHSLHALLTGERRGYYVDFGRPEDLVRGLREAYVYQGEYSAFRRRTHGASPTGCRADQFIVFSQNHDQVGNRLGGMRLSRLVSFEASKLATGCVLFSPFVPLLFMGEEYAETTPFLFFTDHSGGDLCDAVRKGRKEAMEAFSWTETPDDPCDPATFERSKLAWESRTSGRNGTMLAYYREALRLRAAIPALAVPGGLKAAGRIDGSGAIYLVRTRGESEVAVVLNFSDSPLEAPLPAGLGRWRRRLDSSDKCWQGPGSRLPEVAPARSPLCFNPESAVIFEKVAPAGVG